MESEPDKIAAKSIPAIKVVGQELPERTAKLRMGDPFDIDDRWTQKKDAQEEGDDQPLEALGKKVPIIPARQGEVDGDCCYHKKQRHPPQLEDPGRDSHSPIPLRVRYLITRLIIKDLCHMVEKDAQDGQDAEPIEIIPSSGG